METTFHQFLIELPKWAAICIAFIWVTGKFGTPLVESILKTRRVRIKDLEHEIEKLKLEKEKLNLQIANLKEKYSNLRIKNTATRAMLRSFKIYLQDHGFENIPEIDDLFHDDNQDV